VYDDAEQTEAAVSDESQSERQNDERHSEKGGDDVDEEKSEKRV
jgi:hypothetical protein